MQNHPWNYFVLNWIWVDGHRQHNLLLVWSGILFINFKMSLFGMIDISYLCLLLHNISSFWYRHLVVHILVICAVIICIDIYLWFHSVDKNTITTGGLLSENEECKSGFHKEILEKSFTCLQDWCLKMWLRCTHRDEIKAYIDIDLNICTVFYFCFRYNVSILYIFNSVNC